MIVYVKGDLLNDDAEALVNAVNTVGVMGKGLAFQFREKYQTNYDAYKLACKNEELKVGTVLLVDLYAERNPKFIINFPTKAHWKGKSKIEYIKDGLVDLVRVVQLNNIKSVALPALGSGLGGLPWSQVERAIIETLKPVADVEWRVYAPNDKPTEKAKLPLTSGRAAMLCLFDKYLKGIRKKQLSELEAHVLIYLATQSGLTLNGVEFDTYREHPYSTILHHALKKMDGDLLYLSGINKPSDSTFITLEPKALSEAKALMRSEIEKTDTLHRVSNLVSGYESKDGLTILSSAVWLLSDQRSKEGSDLADLTLAAKELLPNHINCTNGMMKGAISRLVEDKWLPELK